MATDNASCSERVDRGVSFVVAAVVASAIVLAGAVGCGPPAARLVPAGGVVLIAGQPAAGVSVQFLPDPLAGQVRPTSFALTDESGRFHLRTAGGGAGAVVGGHTVIFADTLEERPAQGETTRRPPRIDARFSTLTGGVRCEVASDGGEVTLELP